jgi:pantoate--beta-alanine ligase
MQIIHDIVSSREYLDSARPFRQIGLIPTMGALHDGHLALIREAKKHNEVIVVSIFVNPTQFGPNEDLDRYPRTFDSDVELCEKEGVDLIFAPSSNEMYPTDHYLTISIHSLDNHLCGASRPGHFNGVLQVVNKLLHILQPHNAYFGQKDIQQFVLIQTMVREFNIPVSVHSVPTVREKDGLALSSRNRYLTQANREVAPELFQSIHSIGQVLNQQITSSIGMDQEFNSTTKRFTDTLQVLDNEVSAQKERLTAFGFKIDYLEVVDFKSLQPVDSNLEHKRYIVAIAAWIGSTRLIDNIIVERTD